MSLSSRKTDAWPFSWSCIAVFWARLTSQLAKLSHYSDERLPRETSGGRVFLWEHLGHSKEGAASSWKYRLLWCVWSWLRICPWLLGDCISILSPKESHQWAWIGWLLRFYEWPAALDVQILPINSKHKGPLCSILWLPCWDWQPALHLLRFRLPQNGTYH